MKKTYLLGGRLQVTNKTNKPDLVVCALVWFVWEQLRMAERMVSKSHSVIVSYMPKRRSTDSVTGLGAVGDGYARINIPRTEDAYPIPGCDQRLRGTPYEVDYTIRDWQDAIIAVAAHEFTHNLGMDGDDNLQGERMCEMAARDLVLLSRAHSGLVAAALNEVEEVMKFIDKSEKW